jgi:hypothetical protein
MLQVGACQGMRRQPSRRELQAQALPLYAQTDLRQGLVAPPAMQDHRQSQQNTQAARRARPIARQMCERIDGK